MLRHRNFSTVKLPIRSSAHAGSALVGSGLIRSIGLPSYHFYYQAIASILDSSAEVAEPLRSLHQELRGPA
jgi:hypothetical protein